MNTHKKYIFFLLFLKFSCTKPATEKLVATIFGPTGTNLCQESLFFMEDLFTLLATTSSYQQMIACKNAAGLLQKKSDQLERELDETDLFNLPLAFYHIWLITIQKEHFQRCARLFNQELSWITKMYGWIQAQKNYLWCSFVSLFVKRVPTITKITNALVMYTDIERSEIFTNHESTLALLVSQNTQPIPLVIRFWDFPRYRHRLLNGIKEFYQGAIAQSELLDVGEEELEADVAVGVGASAATTKAAAVATKALTKADEDLTAALTPDLNKVLTPAEDATRMAKAEKALVTLEKNITKWSDSFVRKMSAAVGNKVADVPVETSQAAFQEALSPLEQSEVTLAKKAQEAQQALKEAEEQAIEAAKSPFVRKLNKFSQALNSRINPLEKAMTATEKIEGATANVGSKIKKLYDTSFLKTGMGQARTWLKKNAAGKYYEESPKLQTTAHLLSYIGTPTRVIFNFARKFTLTNVYRAAMKTSFGKMLISMIEQSEFSMGAQMVSSWQSATDALVFAALSQQRADLIAQQTFFFSQLLQKQELLLNQMNAQFTAKIATLARSFAFLPDSSGNITIQGLLPSLFSSEQSFISRSLVTTTVKQLFLTNPFFDDQIFYYSSMAGAIKGGITWYNPYRLGNWQFCSIDYSMFTKEPVTSFVQYSMQPCVSEKNPKGDPTIAVQNSIFVEYIPAARFTQNLTESYQIVIDCTLLEKPQTPFIMGVIFNGARWISGVIDFHHQHRLFCLYSLSDQPKNSMNIGFAETFYQTPTNTADDQLADQMENSTCTHNAVWPAYQLFASSETALAALAQKNNIALITNPLAQIPAVEVGVPYRFIITTQPTQVALSLETNNGSLIFPSFGQPTASNATALPTTYQINLLNSLTFLYHNIGFIAAGCSAQFSIKQPTGLVYSNQQSTALQKSLTTGERT